MKDYSLGVLSAGESKQVNAVGSYIRNIGTGSISVNADNIQKRVSAFSTVIGAGGSRSPLHEYTTWTVTNNSLVALPVSVLIGFGEADESEVQINADVNTRWSNLTDNGNQFLAGYTTPAVSGKYSMVGLLNVSADKNVNINRIDFLCSGTVLLCKYAAISAPVESATPAIGNDFSKDFTSATPDAHLLWSNVVGLTARLDGGAALKAHMPASSLTPSTFEYYGAPLILSPGVGMGLVTNALNQSITGLFDFEEVAA